jgi:hypothetical protein
MNNCKFRFVDMGFLVINSVRLSWHALSRTPALFHGCKQRGFEAKVTTMAMQAPCTN